MPTGVPAEERPLWALIVEGESRRATPLNAAAHQEAARYNAWAAGYNRRYLSAQP